MSAHEIKEHGRKSSNFTTFTFFLIIALLYCAFIFFFVLLYKSSTGKSISPAVTSFTISSLTNELNLALAKVEPVKDDESLVIPESIKVIANRRSRLLLGVLKRMPNTAMTDILPRNKVVSRYPRLLSLLQDEGYVEKDVSLEGELRISLSEGVDGIQRTYYLRTVSGDIATYKQIFPSAELPNNWGATQVSLNGISLQGNIAFVPAGVRTRLNSSAENRRLNPHTTGEKKLLIVMVNFANNTEQPLTSNDLRLRLFGEDTASMATYLKEVSFEQLSLNLGASKIMGWVTIPSADTNCFDNYRRWADQADAVIKEQGTDVKNFDVVGYYISPHGSCGPGNTGGIATPPGWAEVGGKRFWINSVTTPGAFAHEFGHTLGLYHAGTMTCGAKIIDDYKNCAVDEYSNPFDLMGGSRALLHFSALHKSSVSRNALGWIANSGMKLVSPNERINTLVTVAANEQKTDQKQLLKIAKPDTGDSYYLEYRRKVGFDSQLPADDDGIGLLYVWSEKTDQPTKLLDLTPGDNIYTNAYFKDNMTFVDEANNILITQVSHDEQGATYWIRQDTAKLTVTPSQ